MTSVPLKHVANVIVSNVDKKSSECELPVRLCNYTDVYYHERITPDLPFMEATATKDQVVRFGLRAGDVLITKDSETADDIAVPAYVTQDLPNVVCGYHLAILRPHSNVDGRYLFWALSSTPCRQQFSVSASGVTRFGLRYETFRDVLVPLPSMLQQRVIADYLDAETARIDTLIERKQRLIALVCERAEVRQELLATGRSLQARLRPSGYGWLGDIPQSWRVVRLKFYARLESGHTPSRTRPELWENCTIPWVTLNDVGYLETHEWVEETTNLVSEQGLANSSARVLPPGTVILSRDATVGRCGILARPMATSQHFADWICNDQVRPRYLWLLFRTALQKHFASLTDGATLRTIGMPDIGQLIIPLPTLDEQDAIVEKAERVRLRASEAARALGRQISLLAERRQALITAAVSGELDVPGLAA